MFLSGSMTAAINCVCTAIARRCISLTRGLSELDSPHGVSADCNQRVIHADEYEIAVRVAYCLSQTVTLSVVCPRTFVPFVVTVRVFPSLDTTVVWVVVILPPFLLTEFVVVALIRVRAVISPYGLLPTTGLS